MAADIFQGLKNHPRSRIFAVAAALVLMFLAGVWAAYHLFGRVSTDDAFVDGDVVPVSPRVSGHIAKVYIADNQAVKEGDPLFDIDDRDYAARRDLALADVDAAKAEAEQAASDLERYEKLRTTGDISEQKYDEAVFHGHAAEAKMAAAEARLEQAELEVSYTRVTAAVTGRVARKSVEQGAFVQAGQVMLALVAPQRWVTANFKETQLTHIRPGQRADIRIDAYPSLVLRGHVDSIQQGTGSRFSLLPAENATGNFIKVVQRVPVKIVFDGAPEALKDVPLGCSVVPTVVEK
ncbi:MAG: efflux RND transporter periplasmic adaptor subunit [Deltaproteobacteria bacterium]